MPPGEAGDLVHERATAYAKQHGCGFHEAKHMVLAGNDALAAAYEVDRQRVVGQQAPQPKITPDMFATSRERAPEGFHTETFENWTHSRGGGRTLYGQLTPEQKAALKPSAGKK